MRRALTWAIAFAIVLTAGGLWRLSILKTTKAAVEAVPTTAPTTILQISTTTTMAAPTTTSTTMVPKPMPTTTTLPGPPGKISVGPTANPADARVIIEKVAPEIEAGVADAVRLDAQVPCAITLALGDPPNGKGAQTDWPSCRMIVDRQIARKGGKALQFVVRHEIAHLAVGVGVPHKHPTYRALESKLARAVGIELVYSPTEEYPVEYLIRLPNGMQQCDYVRCKALRR